MQHPGASTPSAVYGSPLVHLRSKKMQPGRTWSPGLLAPLGVSVEPTILIEVAPVVLSSAPVTSLGKASQCSLSSAYSELEAS